MTGGLCRGYSLSNLCDKEREDIAFIGAISSLLCFCFFSVKPEAGRFRYGQGKDERVRFGSGACVVRDRLHDGVSYFLF